MTAELDPERWDAIVVGSGLGGLTAAGYLAANGRRPLVLEQYDTVGGSTHVFRRRGRFEFDVGVHFIGDCGPDGVIPTILRGLGLDGAVEFLPMDPDGFSTILLPGLTFRVPAGWDAYVERLVATFPAEERALRRCLAVLRRVGEDADQMTVPVGWPATAAYALHRPATLRWGLRPLTALFDRYRLSSQARAVITGESGVYAAPASRVPVAMHAGVMNHYLRSGAYYPRGGGQVIAAHLLDAVLANGGSVRTGALVAEILVTGGRARGVRLESGEVIEADVVISNADPRRTYLNLVGPAHLPRRVVRRAERMRMALPLFCVYLGLDVDLAELLPNTNLWYLPSDDQESLYAAAYRNEVTAELLADPPVYLTSATLKDPGHRFAAPPGHSCVQLMTVVPPDPAFWGLDGPAGYRTAPAYRGRKGELVEAMVRQAERLVPGIAGHVVWSESATPFTQERYTMATAGSCYGLEFALDQFGPRRPGPRTPVRGLYLAGGSTVWCHGIVGSMSGGVGAASAVLGRDLHAEIAAGRRFGDPAGLAAGGPGWDPLEFSRLGTKNPARRRVTA